MIKAITKCMDEIDKYRNVISLCAKYINGINKSMSWLRYLAKCKDEIKDWWTQS